MSLKTIECKLETILENDLFNKYEDSLSKNLKRELDYILNRIAKYNENLEIINGVRIGAVNRMDEDKEIAVLVLKCELIADMLEDEVAEYKIKLINVVEEILTNQELYDMIKEEMPSIDKLVDKLTECDANAALRDFIDWLSDLIDYLKLEDIDGLDAYEYLDGRYLKFYNIYEEDNNYNLVKNVKEGANDEGTGSN